MLQELPEHPQLDESEYCPEQRGEAVQSCDDEGHEAGSGVWPSRTRRARNCMQLTVATAPLFSVTAPIAGYVAVAFPLPVVYLNDR